MTSTSHKPEPVSPAAGSPFPWRPAVDSAPDTVLRVPRSSPDLPQLDVGPSATSPEVWQRLFPQAGDVARTLPPPESVAGMQIGHFQLERRIGMGGMGAVFLANDETLSRQVALKVLSPHLAGDAASVQRFQNEARAAARLDHSHVSRVFFHGLQDGLHYIAYEYVPGANLRDVIRLKGRIEIPETINIAMQLATALGHMAASGVVHRDIKPSNIIVGANSRAKLVDLGLARRPASEISGELTVAGTTLGTFDYISPEQAKDPRDVDVRSDIYSLGCTIYHMLTGEPPYPEGTLLQKLLDHQSSDPPDPAVRNPRVPPLLSQVVRKMMAGDRRRRYAGAEELLQDLAKVGAAVGLRSLPIDSWLLDGIAAARPTFWQQNLSWIATTAVLLLLVLGVQFFPEVSQQFTSVVQTPLPTSRDPRSTMLPDTFAGSTGRIAGLPVINQIPNNAGIVGQALPSTTVARGASNTNVVFDDPARRVPTAGSVPATSGNRPPGTALTATAPPAGMPRLPPETGVNNVAVSPSAPSVAPAFPELTSGGTTAATGPGTQTGPLELFPGEVPLLSTNSTLNQTGTTPRPPAANPSTSTPPVSPERNTSRPAFNITPEGLVTVPAWLARLLNQTQPGTTSAGSTPTPQTPSISGPNLTNSPGQVISTSSPAAAMSTGNTTTPTTAPATGTLAATTSVTNANPSLLDPSGTSATDLTGVTPSATVTVPLNPAPLPGGTSTLGVVPALSDTSTTPVAAPLVDPFLVVGGKSYQSLEAACAAAKDGGIVLLQFDGLRGQPERPIRLVDKRLTIRAATGFRPALEFAPINAPADSTASRMISVAGGALEVVNVDFVFRVPPSYASEAWVLFSLSFPERLKLERVSVTVQNSRRQPAAIVEQTMFAGSAGMGAMKTPVAYEPELMITDSLLRGACDLIRLRDGRPARFTLEDCAVAVDDALLRVMGVVDLESSPTSRTRLDLSHVTCLVGGSVVSMQGSNDFASQLVPLQVSARNNLFHCGPGQAFIEIRGETEAMNLQQLFSWSGEKNLYDNLPQLMNVKSPSLGAPAVPLDFPGWTSLWGGAERQSSMNSLIGWRAGPRPVDLSQLTLQNISLDRALASNLAVAGATDGRDLGADLSRLPPVLIIPPRP